MKNGFDFDGFMDYKLSGSKPPRRPSGGRGYNAALWIILILLILRLFK